MIWAGKILFSACVLLLLYAFLIYPALIFLLSRKARPVKKKEDFRPRLSLLIPVYNEEKVVEAKMQNCLALDYPTELLEIAFASDGSTDRSVDVLRRQGGARITVFEYPTNRGKTAVLNDTIPRLKGDVVVVTDASGLLNRGALTALAPLFHDEDVGCVCGIYHIVKEGRSRMDSAESSYHGFEMQLRMWEGMIRTTLSGTGALCAFRKSDYRPLPEGVINEDYIMPARMALSGKRVIYEPQVHIYDQISTSLGQVFQRRVRIAYGNWQQISYLKTLLDPARGYLAWIFYSHKLVRMAFPFIFLLLLVCSFSWGPWLYLPVLALLLGAFILGLGGLFLDRFVRGDNPLGFIVLVFFNSVAAGAGTLKFFMGKKVKW